MRSVGFFNSKGGVGRTMLVYHLAHMLAEQGARVLAADLDPQANLTRLCLDDVRLECLWSDDERRPTIYGALGRAIRGGGAVEAPHVEPITDNLGLVAGDLALSSLEDSLSRAWSGIGDPDGSAVRSLTALRRGICDAGRAFQADWLLIDVGPNLGALNRAALIVGDHVVIPLQPDLLSLLGLRTLGPSFRDWRATWMGLLGARSRPLGYVVVQPAPRDGRPPSQLRWIERVPQAYREHVLDEQAGETPAVSADQYCLAILKHHRSLLAMAMEARKPVFQLKPADGAIGAHGEAVRRARSEFAGLALRLAQRCDEGGVQAF